jgi:hypothetical protein
MFNVCVDAVIREWLWRTIEEEAAHRRFAGASREIVAFFAQEGILLEGEHPLSMVLTATLFCIICLWHMKTPASILVTPVLVHKKEFLFMNSLKGFGDLLQRSHKFDISTTLII